MGFLSGIGKAFGKAFEGISKFMNSPFGKLLIGVGLTMLTGGVAGIGMLGSLGSLGSGLSALGGLGGGSMTGLFGSFASSFLGSAQSLVSGSGLGALTGFLGNATGTDSLLSMATSLLGSKGRDDEAGKYNASTLFAFNNARLLPFLD
jgi:hypothetical protein